MQALPGVHLVSAYEPRWGRELADLGADVLMIERPMDEARSAYEKIAAGIDGPEDELRHATGVSARAPAGREGQETGDVSYAISALQRNKRSIALNLKEPEAQKIFHSLAETGPEG